ncbi:MAG: DNA-protecting protein DprA [Chloroflexi bacterium]|nr:DNA-protecting protein DprA [Chloroflexota bacterium]
MTEAKYWVGFNRVSGIGSAKLRRLQEFFGGLERAWGATTTELSQAGLDARTIESLTATRARLSLDAEWERLYRHGVSVVTWDDTSYPQRLKEIGSPPPVLYIKGSLKSEDEWAIAVVGTRRATVYGREAAEELVGALARHKITIVSGLAKGIDTLAHRAALEAGGRTVAVTGCGLDITYPADNARLAQSIGEQGALLSEYPLGTKPSAPNFPWRNRIISGMSLGVLVVEAGEDSGAHITVQYALEQNREVFAVPGGIFWPKSKGTNRWIKEGAKLVMGVEDILEELNLQMIPQNLAMKEVLPVTEAEAVLLKHLSHDPLHIDDLGSTVGIPISTVSSTLTMLELKGMVRQVGGMSYVLAREGRGDYRVMVE